MVAGHSLAGQRGCAGYPQEMQEHTALGRFEVIRLDLAGHIHGDEALQSQHHLRQIAVNVVDDLQPQTFFQQQRHAEHPLLGELRVLGHLCHGHIAVQKHRLCGARQHRRLHKVQLAVHHLPQTGVTAAGGQLEGRHRDLQLVKMDGAYVRIQIELIQLGQEAGDAVLPGRMAAQQPILHPPAVGGAVAEIFSGTAQQRGGHLPLGGAVHLPGNIGRHGGGKLLRLRRLTLAPAEAEDGGRVVVGAAAQLRHAEPHDLDQRIEVLPQHFLVRAGIFIALQKRAIQCVRVHARQRLCFGHIGQSITQRCEHGAAAARRALAGAVAAQGRRG